MIQLTDLMTTSDPEINQAISKFISQRLLNITKPMTGYTIDVLKEFFPARYSREKILPVILDFCSLLSSRSSYVPPLIMEYFLFKTIKLELIRCDSLNRSTTEPIPEHDQIIAFLKADPEFSDDFIDDFIEGIENLECYSDTLFWDYDFEFLDNMTEEQLYSSPINESLGIGDKTSIIYIPESVIY